MHMYDLHTIPLTILLGSVSLCAFAAIITETNYSRENSKETVEELALRIYKNSGTKHGIMNTYCGEILLHKANMSLTSDDGKLDWTKFISRNPTMCQCRLRGSPIAKYIHLFWLLTQKNSKSVFKNPYELMHYISLNQTTHILIDVKQAISYYQISQNGLKEEGFVYNIKDAYEFVSANYRNNDLIFHEPLLSHLLRKMKGDTVSITAVNSTNSVIESIMSALIEGVGGFVNDFSLPKTGPKLLISHYDHPNQPH